MPTTIYFSYIQNYTATIHFSCAPPRTVACKAAPASTAPASAELRSQLRALLRASESRPGADFVPSLLASRPPVADALAVVAAAPSKKSDPRALETGAIAPALTPGAAPPPAYAYGAALHREPVVPAAIRRHALSDDVDAEAYLSSGAGAALCRSALSVDRTTGDAAVAAVARICEVHSGARRSSPPCCTGPSRPAPRRRRPRRRRSPRTRRIEAQRRRSRGGWRRAHRTPRRRAGPQGRCCGWAWRAATAAAPPP